MLKKSLFPIILMALFIQGCVIIKHNNQRKENIVFHKPDKPVVMFLLDASESMNEQDLGKIRIVQAKESIINTVSQLDIDRYDTGLIIFNGCEAKLVVEPSSNVDRIVDITRSIKADGKTPLAKAIKFSGRVLENIKDKMVILLSDGKETCGGNPVAEAKKLHERYGIDINFQIIGYAVDDSTRRQLEEISNISEKWIYHDAKDSFTLKQVIDDIMTKNELRDERWIKPDEFVFEFDTDSAQLKREYSSAIQKMYNYLKNNYEHIKIVGHTDSTGPKAHNLKLSKKRAKVIRNELVRLGINSDRITIDGKGEGEPRAKNDTKEGRKRNRRVQILIQKP
jgi:outer membrane protein OmpA-like peptidoglycan-associated protein